MPEITCGGVLIIRGLRIVVRRSNADDTARQQVAGQLDVHPHARSYPAHTITAIDARPPPGNGPYRAPHIRGGACTGWTLVACHIRVTGSAGHRCTRHHSRRPAGRVFAVQRHCPAPDCTARHGLLELEPPFHSRGVRVQIPPRALLVRSSDGRTGGGRVCSGLVDNHARNCEVVGHAARPLIDGHPE